jgi:hypothetical protein
MCLGLTLAADALKVSPVVLAAAFGYRRAVVHLGRRREPAVDEAALAPRFIA